MGAADSALEKIHAAQVEVDKNVAYAKMQREKIDQFEVEANKEHINTIDHFTAHLQNFLMNENKKKITLINGDVSFRNRQPKWSIADPQSTIAELEQSELHDLIRIKKEPALSEIKKHLSIVNGKVMYSKTGEVLKSIIVEEQQPSFSVKLK